MRVAVLHDHLSFIGGGERVALTLASAFGADLFVTDLDPELPRKAGFPDVHATELAKLPTTPTLRQAAQAKAFERARLPRYDAYVLSGNWAVFAAKAHHPNVWYCHTPVRVFYDLRDPFLESLRRWERWAAEGWMRRWEPRYEAAAAKADRIVSNSRNVADRVQKYLRRASSVVYPPVDTNRYRFREIGDFWLSVNRLSHEKRIDLQMEAFRRLPSERLIVVGGSQAGIDAVRIMRGLDPPSNVELLGEVEEDRLLDLYGRCKGFLATSLDEDFGLTPVEAMASGKCVVAVDEGGYRETVVHGETGWLVPPTVEAVVGALEGATPERLRSLRFACELRARRFDRSVFLERMRTMLEEVTGRT